MTDRCKKQECIPVGCIPAAHRPYAGVCLGGCLLRGCLLLGHLLPGGLLREGCVSQHALRQTPSVDRHTLVKILPWPNFVAAGNYLCGNEVQNVSRTIQFSAIITNCITYSYYLAAGLGWPSITVIWCDQNYRNVLTVWPICLGRITMKIGGRMKTSKGSEIRLTWGPLLYSTRLLIYIQQDAKWPLINCTGAGGLGGCYTERSKLNRFEHVWGRVSIQIGPSWTSLNMSGVGGPCTVKSNSVWVMVPRTPPPIWTARLTDTHDRKHHRPATSLTSGNKEVQQSEFYNLRNLTRSSGRDVQWGAVVNWIWRGQNSGLIFFHAKLLILLSYRQHWSKSGLLLSTPQI